MALSSSRITPKEFKSMVQGAGGKSYVPKATEKKLKDMGLSSSYKSISRQQAEKALGELKNDGFISGKKSAGQLIKNTITARDEKARTLPKNFSSSILRHIPKDITKDDLEEMVKDVSGKKYVTREAKKILKESKIGAYPKRAIKRQEVLNVLEKLKASGISTKASNLKKTWEWVDNYSKEKESKSLGAASKFADSKEIGSVKNVDQEKIMEYIKKLSGSKSDSARAQKILDSLKVKAGEEISPGQLDIIFEKLQQAGIAGFKAVKKTWDSFGDFLREGRVKAEKKDLPTLGLEYLPQQIRPDNFLRYLEKVAEDPTAVFVAKNMMEKYNMHAQEHLTERQMRDILKKLQAANLIGTNPSSDPVGKRIAKRESLRQAWVAMGIADEDDEFGRYKIQEDEDLPVGISRSAHSKASSSALAEEEPIKEQLESSLERGNYSSSAAGEENKRKEPTSSIGRSKAKFDKNDQEFKLPDILSSD